MTQHYPIKDTNKTPATDSQSAYYPSKHNMSDMIAQMQITPVRQSIRPGAIARTDGFDVDRDIEVIEQRIKAAEDAGVVTQDKGLLSRMLSVSDLTEKLYQRFADNPNSMYNWLDPLIASVEQSGTSLKVPKTKMMRLPIELAQFIRIEYQNTSQQDKDLFDQIIFDALELEDDQTYFIKTGNFSSKFQFANAKCEEPREMGQYFSVINNFAMVVGAGQTIDLVAREYIEDVENNPTIYNGMPLRTEFRAFVDCDENKVIGVVPYWHPIVMKRALKHGLADSIQADYQTYLKHEDKLTREYNTHLNHVTKEVQSLLPELNLKGQYSIDIMKNGDDFYVIDLALMSESALTELL